MNFDVKDIISLMLVAMALIGVIGGVANRLLLRKGIGSQFIRFMAIVIAFPLTVALILQGLLTEAAATALLGILGYVFTGRERG
jgi:hypothetical protein